ncbi:ABC transporter permease [Halocatena salina]|uniref:ABC transporter permease subunit n=1 Tax=Halocatena salina TaxID=2934340 RepID=A0A8U0A558_9EURY|nr:ABC transporter permease subunit [Halocatena salina]UPM44341.1 ABC transporter permease subunit [Halocatena salina]
MRKRINTVVADWLRRNSASVLIVVGLLVWWELYSRFFNPRGNAYFPSIAFVIDQTLNYQGLILRGIRITFLEIVTGYALAVVIAIPAGIVVSKSMVIRQSSMPFLVYAYSLPAAILAPIFVLWFDSYVVAASVFVAWVSFFPILINTITGFSHVRQELYHLGEVFGATPSQFVRKIEFWEAFPYSASGLKVAVQQAIVGAIVIEFIATTGGLGYLIVNALDLLRQGLLFGVLIIIICFAVIFYNLTAWLISSVTPPLSQQRSH